MRSRCSSWTVAVTAAVVGFVSFAAAAPKNFEPDGMFTGSSLSAWRQIGQASWKAAAGEITGTGKGWLVFDQSYQDLQLEATWRCTGDCQTGILLRAEKTADGGLKGVYVSLTPGDLVSYHVTIDAQGNETSRERLRPAANGPNNRVAPSEAEAAAMAAATAATAAVRGSGAGARGGAGAAPGGGRGTQVASLKVNDWNVVELIIDVNRLRPQVNYGGGIAGGVADSEFGAYGPFALYVGGGEVTFKDIAYKDIYPRVMPDEKVSPKVRLQKLSDYYYSWGPAVTDFNKDGILDIVAGPFVYDGPDFRTRHEMWPAQTLNPSTQFFNGAQYAADFNGDGYPDVINCTLGAPIRLLINPGQVRRRWEAYDVTGPQAMETWALHDFNGDGVQDLVSRDADGVIWFTPDPKDPTGPWIKHPISGLGAWSQHGIGVGDINADGRADVLSPLGWWENPGIAKMSEPWPHHPETFRGNTGRTGGSQTVVFDINGDGLNDVMTSLNAHGFGIAWYEQKKAADGAISFVQHLVMGDYSTQATNAGGVAFSELHGAGIADIDGDGIPDFVTGKREWSELDTWQDPDAYGTPVLYVYRTVRDKKAPGGARFVPELISNRSGIGSNVALVDLNGDKKPEILVSARRGTFLFWNNWK